MCARFTVSFSLSHSLTLSLSLFAYIIFMDVLAVCHFLSGRRGWQILYGIETHTGVPLPLSGFRAFASFVKSTSAEQNTLVQERDRERVLIQTAARFKSVEKPTKYHTFSDMNVSFKE